MNDRRKAPPSTLGELLARVVAPLKEFLDEPLPRGVGFLHTTGSLCIFMAVLQIVTGVLMAFYYTPSPDVAWESVRYVDEKVAFGRVIHGLHHWGSSAFVVIIFIHMIRVFTFAAYKGPRKWTWLVGVGLMGVVLGFGFTGYLLPWDMKAYFGTKVGTNVMGYTPVAGAYLRRFVLGGDEIGEITLPRFYALHVLVLPAALAALMGAHLYLVRLFGITPPFKRDGEPVDYPSRFYPAQAVRDSTMALVVFAVLMTLAWRVGANLGEKADPASTTFAPHPEWYFLGLQQLMRVFPGRFQIIGTFVIPAGAVVLALLLPFIDRNPERRLARRPIALGFGAVVVLSTIGLTIQGFRTLEVERVELAALAAEQSETEAEETTDETAGTPISVGVAFEFTESQVRVGQRLYEGLECADCHEGENVGHDLNLPPALDYAGDRFRPGWLMTYLREVPRRRYSASEGRRPIERMPDYRLEPNEIEALTALLMTFRRPDLLEEPRRSFDEPTEEKIQLGRELYVSESCETCHKLDGEGGEKAPDLTGVGSALNPAFIFEIIKRPQTLIPDTSMEDVFLSDEEIEALTYYLMSFQ